MERIQSPAGASISYERYGSGPPLVLVHGAFSDHRSNWQFVKPFFETRFRVHAVARRGRGETDATEGHALEDEGQDVAAVIQAVGEPVFLLGHSYGGQTALAAALNAPDSVRKLVLYEPPWPQAVRSHLAPLGRMAGAGEWEEFTVFFFRDGLSVPPDELAALRGSALWADILADAEASWADLRALARYEFGPGRFRALSMPVLLQIGTESPRDLYVTDALRAVLPDVRIGQLAGQAHEAMTTAPEQYAEAVARFLLE